MLGSISKRESFSCDQEYSKSSRVIGEMESESYRQMLAGDAARGRRAKKTADVPFLPVPAFLPMSVVLHTTSFSLLCVRIVHTTTMHYFPLFLYFFLFPAIDPSLVIPPMIKVLLV